jgi:YD repeat-containing protein
VRRFCISQPGGEDTRYDANGNRTGATSGSSSSALPANEAYSYDANGNRTGATAGSSSSVYVVGPNNEVLSDGTYSVNAG